MAETMKLGEKDVEIESKKNQKPCPSGFYRDKTGKCVQAGVGPEYKP